MTSIEKWCLKYEKDALDRSYKGDENHRGIINDPNISDAEKAKYKSMYEEIIKILENFFIF